MCHMCRCEPEINLQGPRNINTERRFHASTPSSFLWRRRRPPRDTSPPSTRLALHNSSTEKHYSEGHIPLLFCRGSEGLLLCPPDLPPQSWIQRSLRLKCCHCRPTEKTAIIIRRIIIKNTVIIRFNASVKL